MSSKLYKVKVIALTIALDILWCYGLKELDVFITVESDHVLNTGSEREYENVLFGWINFIGNKNSLVRSVDLHFLV